MLTVGGADGWHSFVSLCLAEPLYLLQLWPGFTRRQRLDVLDPEEQPRAEVVVEAARIQTNMRHPPEPTPKAERAGKIVHPTGQSVFSPELSRVGTAGRTRRHARCASGALHYPPPTYYYKFLSIYNRVHASARSPTGAPIIHQGINHHGLTGPRYRGSV